MFCPECRSEYRPGFTRCGSCDVDLVAELAPEGQHRHAAGAPASHGPMVDFCGFLSLDEAREARDVLKTRSLRSEIAIRDAAAGDAPVREEFWLRIPAGAFDAAKTVLGYADADDSDDGDDALCSECGEVIRGSDEVCPRCGSRFD